MRYWVAWQKGTDRIAGALADMTDAALGAAADATDDSVKDTLVGAYGSLVDAAGSWALTPDRSLQGERVRSETTTPVPMRPTTRTFPARSCSLAVPRWIRAAGNTVELSCSLDIEEGEAAVFLCSGSDDPVILLSGSGDYSSTIEVGGGSTYIGVWGEEANGSASIQIE